MKRPLLQHYLPAAVLILTGFAALAGLSGFIERRRPSLPEGYVDSDLSVNGSRLKGFALGTEGLIADWYFMRSLQYIGDKMLSRKSENFSIDDLSDLNPRLLYPLLANATDLDPHFIAAYSYGAVVLPAIDAEKAIELTKKGIANNPASWRLYQHLGYIYWKLGRYDEASKTYEAGSQIPGAAPFMKLMAGSMKTEGGGRDTARAIYREMLSSSDDEQVAITATRRLRALDSLDELEVIDRVLADFKNKANRCAASFGEVSGMLMTAKLPGNRQFKIDNANRLVDPSGAPYLIDKISCRAMLDQEKTGIALH
ncbi:hypothetical protein BH10ACI2_BH10ACI2_01010 [soil metagenome]